MNDEALTGGKPEWAAMRRARAAANAEADEEYGSASGTVRVLTAAVLRLADENLALAQENEVLKEALAEAASARLEIADEDGRVTEIAFGLEEDGDELQIASPPAVFRRIGERVMEGLADGLAQTRGVEQQMRAPLGRMTERTDWLESPYELRRADWDIPPAAADGATADFLRRAFGLAGGEIIPFTGPATDAAADFHPTGEPE